MSFQHFSTISVENNPGHDKDTLIFTFVGARLVDTEGKPVPAIGWLPDQKALPAKAP